MTMLVLRAASRAMLLALLSCACAAVACARAHAQAGGSTAELKLTKRTGGLKGYVGTIAIGVAT